MFVRLKRLFFVRLQAAVILAVSGYAASASDDLNIGQGMLAVPSLDPGHLLRPNASIAAPSYAPKGSWVSFASLTWCNVWDLNDHYRIDGEWLLFSAKGAYVLLDNLEIGLNLPIIERSGGVADGMIENFHRLFSLDNANRENYPRDELVIEVMDSNGERVGFSKKGWGIGDVSMFSDWIISRGSRVMPATVLESYISFPTGDEENLQGIGEPVFGMALLTSKRIGESRWLISLGGSGSYCQRDEMLGVELNKYQFSLFSGGEYELNPRLSLIMQIQALSPFAKDFYGLSDPTYDINLGMKHRVGKSGTLEVSFQENLFYYNNSADFGVHIGYRQIL